MKKACRKKTAAMLCAASLLGFAGVAHAEETKRYELEPIKVTAQKREESLREVPAAISVFTEENIEEAGLENTLELSRYAPNVYVKDSGSYYQTTIRGISGFILSTHSATSYYVDDINLPAVFMQNAELLDIERVEILKGPQGTLYGRNSEAGVINIITNKPGNTFKGRFFDELSFYDTNHGYEYGNLAGGNISGPIIKDRLYLGFAGAWDYNKGYVENTYNDDDKARRKNQLNGRGTVRWTPDDAWDVTFTAEVMNSNNKFAMGRFVDGPMQSDLHTVNMDGDYYRDFDSNGQALRISRAGSHVDFTSITGRRYYNEDMANDMDMTPMPMIQGNMEETVDFWSQEFRFSSAASRQSPLTWLTGAYFFKDSIDVWSGPGGMMPLAARDTDIDITGAAVFAQATYTLMDRLHLTGGARYDYSYLKGKQDYSISSMGIYDSYDDSDHNGEFLPKVSIAYDVTGGVMAYATVAKGYLNGGYDYTSATSERNLYYKPEYSWSYEIGVKSSWLDNRLNANISAFYVDMKDKQVSEVDPVNTLGIIMSNAAEAHSLGAEVELSAMLAQGLELFANFGYTSAKIDDWYDEAAGYDYDGKYLPNVPKFNYVIGTQYHHASGLWGRAEVVGIGRFYHDAQNELPEGSYNLVNLRLGYAWNNFDITLWCKNLLDKHYNNVRFSMTGMGEAAFEGAPRQVGATAAYRF